MTWGVPEVPPPIHGYTDETEALANAVLAHARKRVAGTERLGRPTPAEELSRRAGPTITARGIGGEAAFRLWADLLEPSTISPDHPGFLAFVPGDPTPASVLIDLAVSASAIYGGSWIEGAGAVWAENEVLRWLADLAGLPPSAGGCFVSGGTAGNLSALVAARHAARVHRGGPPPPRWRVLAADTVHASVASAARVMDVDLVPVEHDERGRLTGAALAAALNASGAEGAFAVAASAGSTNAGVVDDLAGIGAVCRERGLWLHVDGAYGGAALLAPSVRHRFEGIELADSFIVDPHKWLFAPFDSCALLYRDPATARAAHRQDASYLDSLNASSEWNPSDFAHHLSRRPRGLPLWFSLAVHGTDAYREAVEGVLAVTREAAEEIRRRPGLELILEPELSVVLFRRTGWGPDDYETWWPRVLDAQVGFVQPTTWEGERVARLCFVNPRTTVDHVRAILGTMA